MYLLDTDTLSYLHAGHPKVAERLSKLDDPEVGITIITKIELLRGRFEFLLKAANSNELLKAQHWLTITEALLEPLLVIPIEKKAAMQFDRLCKTPALRKIGRADLLIASIALSHRAILVSRNLQHFSQVPYLKVVNWVD
jgi:tRNA(fMet)-specific endonuclease VapC